MRSEKGEEEKEVDFTASREGQQEKGNSFSSHNFFTVILGITFFLYLIFFFTVFLDIPFLINSCFSIIIMMIIIIYLFDLIFYLFVYLFYFLSFFSVRSHILSAILQNF